MKLSTKLSILLFLITLNGFSQSLSDKIFISEFKKVEMNLSNISPNDSVINWQLVVGYCRMNIGKEKVIQELSDSLCKHIINMKKYEKCEKNCWEQYSTDNNDSKFEMCIKKCDSTYSYKFSENKVKLLREKIDELNQLDYTIEYQYLSNQSDLTSGLLNSGKLCKNNGFGTWCPPDFCDWKILSRIKEEIRIIDTFDEIRSFLGDIDNATEAYILFLASQQGDSNGAPRDKMSEFYRLYNNSHYFLIDLQLSDCPIKIYKCLIMVSKTGIVKIIDKILISEPGGCK
jgi:hypothetical protein